MAHSVMPSSIPDLRNHGDTILKAIADEGHVPKQIKYILLTHAHRDHAGSAAQLRNATGAKLFSHALDAEIIESGVHQRPMTPAPGILNRILFQLFVKDLLPVPRTTVECAMLEMVKSWTIWTVYW